MKKNAKSADTEDDNDSEASGQQKEYLEEDSFDDEIDFACDDEGNFKEGDAKPVLDEHEGSFEVAADEEAQNDQANFYVYEKMQIKSMELGPR